MYLQRLRLTNFRNYETLDLTLRPGLSIFQGRNAQGKSNLLESIALLATSRSFRAGGERETVRWGAPGHFARVDARLARRAGPLSVEIVIADPKPPAQGETRRPEGVGAFQAPPALRKRIKINGSPRRAMDLLGQVNVVLFAPPDLDLVIGTPQYRRHYLDVTLCQVSHRYCHALSQFQKVQAQRAALLRRIRENQEDPRSLAFWDEQFVTLGGTLMLERARLIERVNTGARGFYEQLSGGAEEIQVIYRPSFAGAGAPTDRTVESLTSAFRAELSTLRRREIHAGVNLLGPHRDDVAFLSQQMDLAVYGSRGQQRSAALATKLAELHFLQEETGEQPILLLDDVLSELDEERRSYLLGMVRGLEQVLLTTTERAALPADLLSDAACYTVVAGAIQEMSAGG
ncbi:MAG TPA: DNA replication and repair protein RecF [Ktedonobacterales bacterium]|jgi:DNA replication and repair protein RecF